MFAVQENLLYIGPYTKHGAVSVELETVLDGDLCPDMNFSLP